MQKDKLLLFSLIPTTMLPITSISCIWHNNDNKMNITRRRYKFYNLSNEFDIKNTSVNFYFKNNETVPYVSVDEMINALDGFLKSYSVNSQNSLFFNQKYYYQNAYKMSINWKNNKITVNSLNFFKFTNWSSGSTDYSNHLKWAQYSELKTKDYKSKIEFNLDKYKLDILNWYEKTLIPLPVFNTLFCSQNYYNLYFNGQNLYGVDFGLNDNQTGIETLKTGGFENRLQNKEDRQTTLNHLLWTLDHFYGLKNIKSINNFSDYLTADEKYKILSTSVNDNNEAYGKLFHTKLNDLHTWLSMLSFYNDKTKKVSSLDLKSANEIEYDKVRNKLKQARRNRFGSENNVPPVRFINETAIVSFDSFKTGTNEEIQKSDAYKYDTYEFMHYVMKEIKKRGNKIKNIVIDLSLNGGGNVGAMLRALGFLTNKPIEEYEYDTLSKIISREKIMIDTNKDRNYDFLDGYPEYNWSVLTGRNTFSAANLFTAIAKSMKIAKIIGQQSGGGECSIMPNVLADGTSFVISSNNASRIKGSGLEDDENNYRSIENGIMPDFSLKYENFYNDIEIDKLAKIK